MGVLGSGGEWASEHGIDPRTSELSKLITKSMGTSLNNLQKQSDMTNQAIIQTDHNANALLTASKGFSRSNYPLPNKIITMTGEQLGSPERQAEVGRFKIALLAFSREYMRVVTGAARSVAELSITAQDTADTILSKFDSWSTLEAKVKQAQIEIGNVQKSYKEALDTVQKSLPGEENPIPVGGGLGSTPGTPPPASGLNVDMDAVKKELARRKGQK